MKKQATKIKICGLTKEKGKTTNGVIKAKIEKIFLAIPMVTYKKLANVSNRTKIINIILTLSSGSVLIIII